MPLSLGFEALSRGFEIGTVMLLMFLGFVKSLSLRSVRLLSLVLALMNGTEDTAPLCPLCPAKDGLGVDNEVLNADGWGLIEGREVLSNDRGTPLDGRGTPPNEGLGAPPNEGLGTPLSEGRGIPAPASPPVLTLSLPLPNSTDPRLDALEYVLNLESEGGYFFGVKGSGGSDLSMLHDDGVDERDGGRVMPDEGLGRVSEKATGLWGVAGKGRDNEEVEAVLEPLPVPPISSPLELDPTLSRKSARVGVTPCIPSSSGNGTRELSSLCL